MRRIAGLSNKKPLKKPAAKVRKAPPKRVRKAARKRPVYCCDLFGRLFRDYRPHDIQIWSDRYPAYMRANLQPVIEELFMANADQCVGATPRYSSHDLDMSELISSAPDERIAVGPISRVAVDPGEDEPVRCVRNALILHTRRCRHAIFIFVRSDPGGEHRYTSMSTSRCRAIIPAARPSPTSALHRSRLRSISAAPIAARCCRWRNRSTMRARRRHPGHRMKRGRSVRRDPARADNGAAGPLRAPLHEGARSIAQPGCQSRAAPALWPARHRQDPHHPLSRPQSARHTTLLITAEQVGLLPHYMSLARLLQPAMVVIEDVDLIARVARDAQRVRRDDAELAAQRDGRPQGEQRRPFHPHHEPPRILEAALAIRPGRIDQAIEVPVPERRRDKLVQPLRPA